LVDSTNINHQLRRWKTTTTSWILSEGTTEQWKTFGKRGSGTPWLLLILGLEQPTNVLFRFHRWPPPPPINHHASPLEPNGSRTIQGEDGKRLIQDAIGFFLACLSFPGRWSMEQHWMDQYSRMKPLTLHITALDIDYWWVLPYDITHNWPIVLLYPFIRVCSTCSFPLWKINNGLINLSSCSTPLSTDVRLFVLAIARDILRLHHPNNVMLFCSHVT
jgi:hypothetical protein